MCERCEELIKRASEVALWSTEGPDRETIARAFYEVNVFLGRVAGGPFVTVGRDDACAYMTAVGDFEAALMALTITLGMSWAAMPIDVRSALRRTIGELGTRIETAPDQT